MRIYTTIHEAYLETLKEVLDFPDYRPVPRGQPTREKVDYMFKIINPKAEPIKTNDPERNVVIEQYTKRETDLYNLQTNSVADFAKASKFWQKLVNPDGSTINSAYGHLIWNNKSQGNPKFEVARIFGDDMAVANCNVSGWVDTSKMMRTPWEWCRMMLSKDKDTRQAIMRFNLPCHCWDGNADFVCTMHGNWLIREDKLHLTIIMRSNDLHKGLVYDLPWFISLIEKMVNELKDVHPNLMVGSYTHLSHSMHIYERDIPQILKMIGRE